MKAIYAGSFDPPTIGHYHVIEKARKMFDDIAIVIADNPNKIPTFSVEERKEMLKEGGFGFLSSGRVTVEVLPSHLYTVDYAQQIGAKYLIRGIRDIFDFSYEQSIYKTNLQINPNIETVYMMPEQNVEMVSSSWVKGLVGKKGWRSVLQHKVGINTIKSLKKLYLKERFMKLDKALLEIERVWQKIQVEYDRDYHNYDHLIDMLEYHDTYSLRGNYTMEIAIFLHDLYDSEEKCAEHALNFVRNGCIDVEELIMATKHTEVIPKSDKEKAIASYDLLVLAQTPEEYARYVQKVQWEIKKNLSDTNSSEDFNKEWNRGRSEFLKMMLNKDRIYLFDEIPEDCEHRARGNMKHELNQLENEK